jgi:hypothetical protein
MPMETVLTLFAIVIPFAIFAGVLAWAQGRTAELTPDSVSRFKSSAGHKELSAH